MRTSLSAILVLSSLLSALPVFADCRIYAGTKQLKQIGKFDPNGEYFYAGEYDEPGEQPIATMYKDQLEMDAPFDQNEVLANRRNSTYRCIAYDGADSFKGELVHNCWASQNNFIYDVLEGRHTTEVLTNQSGCTDAQFLLGTAVLKKLDRLQDHS